MRGGTSAAIAAMVVISSWACGARESVPRGETVVVIDTDLPVPDVVTSARVDVYAGDGRWLASRDIEAAESSSWPLSFGLAAGDVPERRLVRVRVFPKHRMRDYAGVRRAHVEPSPVITTPSTIEEMCRALPELALGGRVTMHYGTKVFTSTIGDQACPAPGPPSTFQVLVRGGAAGARVTIAEKGRHRFEAVRTTPQNGDFILMVRRECADAESEVGCFTVRQDDALEVDLDPGTYALVAAASIPGQAGDVIVQAMRKGAVVQPTPPPSDGPAVPAVAAPPWPRLVGATGRDETPPTEPQDAVTTDSFTIVELAPNRMQTARITLSGECTGKPAELVAADERRLDPLAVRACSKGTMNAPASASPSAEGGDGPTRAGTFAAARPCQATAPGRVCVEGGMFVLGSELYGGTGIGATTPERTARIGTFYVDQQEFSVADYRAALAGGFVPEQRPYVKQTDGPLDVASMEATNVCTFSKDPLGREDHPLNCVAWHVARALCQRRAGDLPTEAMWEYLARKAGRARSTQYPWGDDEPTCERAVFDRSPRDSQADGACLGAPGGAGPQRRARGADDQNPIGVLGLGGNVSEWCRDTFSPYQHDCWRNAPLDDPWCDLAHAPMRSLRGGSWGVAVTLMASSLRDADAPSRASSIVGFRCVYSAP